MKKIAVFIILVSILSSCSSKVKSQEVLKVLQEIKLKIAEPSGITYYKKHLYIASDNNGRVYKTDLNGKTKEKIQTDFTDLEGVTVNDKGDLFIINETKRTLVKLKATGKTANKYKIKGNQNNENSGLEGVCFNPIDSNYFILNESSPKQLLTVSEKGGIIDKIKIPFAKDLSGICFDEKLKCLWIVSDESQKIYKVSLKGEKLKNYKIPVNKAEGIAVYKDKIYIVSDSENKLYVFKKP